MRGQGVVAGLSGCLLWRLLLLLLCARIIHIICELVADALLYSPPQFVSSSLISFWNLEKHCPDEWSGVCKQ
jgi:hypothetical protein